MTVDLEDEESGLSLAASGRVVPPTDRMVCNTRLLLGLLDEFGLKATWFVLGEVAEHFPTLVRRLADQGHEIGVHGYHHHRLYELTPESFRASICRAKAVVEDAAGVRVRGHRAAAMSLTRATWWALDVLAEVGFEYDSSVFPFERSERYGVAGAPVGVHVIDLGGGRRIVEIPLSVVTMAGRRLPVCGGGYLRHFPMAVTRWAMRRLERASRPAVVYLHPYEVDPGARQRGFMSELSTEEREKIGRLVKGQYRNRDKTLSRLRALFAAHRFAPLEHVFQAELARAAPVRDGSRRTVAGAVL